MRNKFTISLLLILLLNATISFGQALNPNATKRGSGSGQQGNVGLGAVNDILASFTAPSPIGLAWGVAHDGQNLFITDPNSSTTTIYKVSPSGTNLGTITINEGQSWIGDMASDGTYLYACLVGGSNNIVKINIATGAIVQTISGAWNSTSQRGLAYDAALNELYFGGWNTNMIWRVSASTGATISSFSFNGVSGLAWHPNGGPGKQGSLWVVTNANPSRIAELDPHNSWGSLQLLNFPETAPFSGAGAEIDPSGALWVANQNENRMYLIDLNEPQTVPVSTWSIIGAFLLILTFTVVKFKNII